ncbi:hypothetical protein Taro_051250, partial [Colocasia esculenta]|nr:hypothetical protein [Colocasia esculenta]
FSTVAGGVIFPYWVSFLETHSPPFQELLVAEELWNDHKKLIFFPVASAATCTDSHLEVDQ